MTCPSKYASVFAFQNKSRFDSRLIWYKLVNILRLLNTKHIYENSEYLNNYNLF